MKLQTYNGPLALTLAMSWCASTLANFVEGAGIADPELIKALRRLGADLHRLAKADEQSRSRGAARN